MGEKEHCSELLDFGPGVVSGKAQGGLPLLGGAENILIVGGTLHSVRQVDFQVTTIKLSQVGLG